MVIGLPLVLKLIKRTICRKKNKRKKKSDTDKCTDSGTKETPVGNTEEEETKGAEN